MLPMHVYMLQCDAAWSSVLQYIFVCIQANINIATCIPLGTYGSVMSRANMSRHS